MTRHEMRDFLKSKKLLALLQNEMLDYFQQERNYVMSDDRAYSLGPNERDEYLAVIRALEYITCIKVTILDIEHATVVLEELDHQSRTEENTDENMELPF